MSAEDGRKGGEGGKLKPPVWVALMPVVVLIGALYMSVVRYSHLGLTSHIALIIGAVMASFVAIKLGLSWNEVEDSMVKGISLATKAAIILLVIGMLVGSWIDSGIVPAMIYYGLTLLTPAIFLVATCIICCLVSLATGSSWSTAATVGIALIGVGEGLGINRSKTAGAVISGAYFGDKMSPLSDTTNLAPAMAGALLFDHIRHMVYTTGPSLLISLVLFGLIGHGQGGAIDSAQVEGLRGALREAYTLHPLLLVPPLLVIGMVVLRIPAVPAVMGGWALGAVVSATVQKRSLGQSLLVAYQGVTSNTGHALVDKLLTRGGLSSMFSTVALILCAMCFGGVMERSGQLDSLAGAVLSLAKGTGGLVAATVFSCIGMNLLGSDQYLAVVVPGRMFRGAYRARGLAPKNLSRALEDAGTLTSSLIPWNTCGAYMTSTLGIKPWTYVPYCFLNLINPLVSIFYGFTGITIAPLTDAEREAAEREEQEERAAEG